MESPKQIDLKSHPYRYWWVAIALFGVMLSGVGIDLNMPSLPAVADHFNVNKSFAQLTITAYLIGFGLTQMFAGALADSIGRKKPFVIGGVVYVLVNLLAPFSQDIYQLLGLRFIQGVSVAFCLVSMRAVIPDLFEGAAFKRMVNYMTMAWSLGPITAPAIGGYLQALFDWQGPFYFLAGYGAVLLILAVVYIPETIPKKTPFKFGSIITNSARMLRSKGYVLSMIYTGLLYAMLVLFGVVASFLMQDVLGYSAIDFGHAALLMGLAWFLGNTTNRLTLEMSPGIKMTLCFWMMFLIAAAMLMITLWVGTNIYNIVIPVFLMVYFAAIIFPNYYAKSVALFPEMAASANSLMASSMLLMAGLVSALGSTLKVTTQLPFSLTYFGLALISLGVFHLTGRAETLEE